MTSTTDIRTRPDGSIDTAYYIDRGRRLRSEQAHRMVKGAETEKRLRRSWVFGNATA